MFLHPTILFLGLAAATLPVLIHWLTRPKPTRLPLSTIRFVRHALEQRRARYRLRDALVLALRTAAVLLLAAGLARPLIYEPPRTQFGEAPTNSLRVVLVDVSQSMAAQSSGVTSLERGRSVAARYLEFRPGLRTNLILAAARPQPVFTGPSNNFLALREALAAAAANPQRLLVQPALNLAAEMLAGAAPESARRELIIVSDFQRTNWTTADFSTLPVGTSIELQSVGPAEVAGNLAILRVGANRRSSAGHEQRLEVDVGNFSATARNVRIEVRLGDATYELAGTAPPFSTATLTTTIRPERSGWRVGEARLLGVEDSLAADDRRPCVLEVPPPPSYLLVTRQLERQRPSSSYYVERALLPWEADDRTGSRVERIAPDALDNQNIASAELMVMDHPGKLPSEVIGVVASHLRRGRGLLYVASEPTDAVNLKLLGEAIGHSLKMPVEFQHPSSPSARRDLFITSLRRQDPPFAVFGDELTSLTRQLRFSGGLATRRLREGLVEDVRATLSDGSALVVTAATDAGSLAVLNADLERSNLSVSPLFVPLVAELTQELLGKKHGPSEFPSGEPLNMAIASASDNAGELTVVGGPTEAGNQRGEIALDATGPHWRWTDAGPPGVYEIKKANDTVCAAAIAIPEEESDLRSLPAEVFEQRLAGQRRVHFHSWSPAGGQQQDSIWMWLVVACLFCVLGELAALRCFRS